MSSSRRCDCGCPEIVALLEIVYILYPRAPSDYDFAISVWQHRKERGEEL